MPFAYLAAETWLGPAAAVVQDVMEPGCRAQASALYIMINTVIGELGGKASASVRASLMWVGCCCGA
jgi:hypothetical protein